MILPGSTLGVLGGGQLGRMFCMAARSMGYHTVTLDPKSGCPAASVADTHIKAEFTDSNALAKMAEICDAITIEFENVPRSALDVLSKLKPVHPSGSAVEIAQHRIEEKTYASRAGLNPAPYARITSEADFQAAVDITGFPAVLKTTTLGYDGKGQRIIQDISGLHHAFTELGGVEVVLEKMIDIQLEVSVLLSRNSLGDIACYPLAENEHRNGILHQSIIPARVSSTLSTEAISQASKLAQSMEYVGVLAVEFFITSDNTLVFNEMAPRPHNTGHYTLDATLTSQFQQQVRALCGLPLGDTTLLSPAVMINLLGDLWPIDWAKCINNSKLKLHLYGKEDARRGRKMGHFNVLADNIENAMSEAEQVFSKINTN